MTLSLPAPSWWQDKARRSGWFCLLIVAVLTLSYNRSLRSYSAYAVLSGSMGRAAPRGSLIIAQRQAAAAYRIGDIVTFPLPTQPDQTVTHRVVRLSVSKGVETAATKGDANPNGDGWIIPTSRIIGKAVVIVPFIGYLSIALHTKVGFICFALVTMFAVVLPLLRDAVVYEEGRA